MGQTRPVSHPCPLAGLRLGVRLVVDALPAPVHLEFHRTSVGEDPRPLQGGAGHALLLLHATLRNLPDSQRDPERPGRPPPLPGADHDPLVAGASSACRSRQLRIAGRGPGSLRRLPGGLLSQPDQGHPGLVPPEPAHRGSGLGGHLLRPWRGGHVSHPLRHPAHGLLRLLVANRIGVVGRRRGFSGRPLPAPVSKFTGSGSQDQPGRAGPDPGGIAENEAPGFPRAPLAPGRPQSEHALFHRGPDRERGRRHHLRFLHGRLFPERQGCRDDPGRACW